jgi:hypothetical protein
MIFSTKGRYLFNLGSSGQGPEEYLYIRNIFTFNDSVFLYTVRPEKIRIYHLNGQLINIIHKSNNIPVEYVPYYILLLQPHIFIADVVTPSTPKSISSYPRAILLQEENNQLTIAKKYPDVNLKKERPGMSITYEVAHMYRFKDEIRTYKAINDTIFTVTPDLEMRKAFVFDFGIYRASTKYMFEMAVHVDFKYIWPLKIMESSNYLFIEFFFGKHATERFDYLRKWNDGSERMVPEYRVFGLFDKRTGELKLMNQPIRKKLGFNNDIDRGPVIWPTYISSKDELVSFVHPEEFLEYYYNIIDPSAELTEIAKKLKSDDNPVVIIAKLK